MPSSSESSNCGCNIADPSPTSTIPTIKDLAEAVKNGGKLAIPPVPLAKTNPLEPLTAAEIAIVGQVVKAEMKDAKGIRFEIIELKEPLKEDLKDSSKIELLDRQALASVYKMGSIGVWAFTINVTKKTILTQNHTPEACPMIQYEEFTEIEDAVRADPDFQAACKRRGVDVSLICVDSWSAGSYVGPGEEGKHIAHTFIWCKTSEFDNLYAHPIEGLNAVVDIKAMKVLRVDDVGDVPVPMTNCNYESEFQETTRKDLRPIDVVQPEGVSFKLEGRHIDWHEWSMVIGFNAREGLTLHDIRYGDRSILFRASISEMTVPYGSPMGAHHRKNVFDIGEYGIGKLTNSLELGCDCLGSIHYLDAWMSDMNGEPMCIKNAICIHEEDAGILWKHWEFRTDHTEVRRSRRLVISSICTVGNYEYGSYWYFYLDGTIKFEMKATGIINTVGCVPGEGDKYGTEVMPGVLGQIHQHHFCARLDLSVDGLNNTVTECDTLVETDPAKNPYGNAFFVHETPISVEGGRSRNPDTERFWKFTSNEHANHMGKPTAYKLHPTDSVKAFNDPNSASGRRMPFIYKHLWVTPFREDERFPGGHYMNHSDGSDGLGAWTQQGRNVQNEDIVAWHVFGLHHPTRMEDFPVQPVVSTGFTLKPTGFFDRNPCLDLPADKNKASCPAKASQL